MAIIRVYVKFSKGYSEDSEVCTYSELIKRAERLKKEYINDNNILSDYLSDYYNAFDIWQMSDDEKEKVLKDFIEQRGEIAMDELLDEYEEFEIEIDERDFL